MYNEELENDYFEWLYSIINKNRPKRRLYRKLCMCLHSIDFFAMIKNDENRSRDGIDMRYMYAHHNDIPSSYVMSAIGNKPCSVLEMMIALSIKCEGVMSSTKYDDRTSKWFWEMIFNLKLDSAYDAAFDKNYVMQRIDIFLNRNYEENGEGGLFTIKNPPKDLRTVEIWYQLCWHINDIC